MDIEEQSATGPTSQSAKGKRGGVVVLVAIVVLGLALVAFVYETKYRQATSATHANRQLTSQIALLKANIQKQNDMNNGAAAVTGAAAKASVVSMVNGAVAFTLPQGWTQTPANGCAGGGNIDSQILCYDVANITASDKTFSAGVAVYQYSVSDGTAKQWAESKYDSGLDEYITPSVAVLSDASVNGDSAFSYTLTEPAAEGQSTPD